MANTKSANHGPITILTSIHKKPIQQICRIGLRPRSPSIGTLSNTQFTSLRSLINQIYFTSHTLLFLLAQLLIYNHTHASTDTCIFFTSTYKQTFCHVHFILFNLSQLQTYQTTLCILRACTINTSNRLIIFLNLCKIIKQFAHLRTLHTYPPKPCTNTQSQYTVYTLPIHKIFFFKHIAHHIKVNLNISIKSNCACYRNTRPVVR